MRQYDDIICLPHYVSERHARMPIADRAAQFSPFAALTGYDDAIEETARLTDMCIELDEGGKALLDEKLQQIRRAIDTQPEITVTWFRADERKDGGAYADFTGRVKKLDAYEQAIVFTDGTAIPIRLIYHIEAND